MRDRLHAALERAQGLGYLGPGPVEVHLDHADGFVRAWAKARDHDPERFCDLGAGGGVPGLILGVRWPSVGGVLLEAAARRCEFLREAIRSLGLEARLEVAEGRAEILAREPALTGTFDLVTARSFGRPGVTAECAARLLSDSGLLLVADPPIDQVPVASRWPAGGLEQLGLRLQDHLEAPAVAVIAREGSCPDRYPRRSGVPEKRPIF